jgi:hypothetical protein
VDHDVAALSITEADNGLAFDISALGHSHDSVLAAASSTLNLEDTSSQMSVAGWVSGDVKAPAHEAASTHSGESELGVSAHDVVHLEKDADFGSVGSHSDSDGAEPPATYGQKTTLIALTKMGSSVPVAATVPSDSHTSDSQSAPSSSTFIAQDASSALVNALHIDPQSLHPIVLAATNLTEAIQVTFQELNQESGTLGQLAGGGISAANIITPLPTGPIQYDGQAQQTLSYFLNHTNSIEIESFGHDLLIVDKDVSHFAASTVESWTMADGSTLSIVGIMANHSAATSAAA